MKEQIAQRESQTKNSKCWREFAFKRLYASGVFSTAVIVKLLEYSFAMVMPAAQTRNVQWMQTGRAESILSQYFIHRFSPRQLIN